jgi:hypothetical protein
MNYETALSAATTETALALQSSRIYSPLSGVAGASLVMPLVGDAPAMAACAYWLANVSRLTGSKGKANAALAMIKQAKAASSSWVSLGSRAYDAYKATERVVTSAWKSTTDAAERANLAIVIGYLRAGAAANASASPVDAARDTATDAARAAGARVTGAASDAAVVAGKLQGAADEIAGRYKKARRKGKKRTKKLADAAMFAGTALSFTPVVVGGVIFLGLVYAYASRKSGSVGK